MKPIVGYRTLAFIHLEIKSSRQSGTLRPEVWALEKAGSMRFRIPSTVRSRLALESVWLVGHCRWDGVQRITESNKLVRNSLSGMAMIALSTRRMWSTTGHIHTAKVREGTDIGYALPVISDISFTDVHSGIYAIFGTNLTTQKTTTLVSSSPGGASRPELSRDGRTLAFVRRVRDKEALVLKWV